LPLFLSGRHYLIMKKESIIKGEIERKIIWMMALRVLIVTTLLGSVLLIQYQFPEEFQPYWGLYYVIGLTYFLSIIYAIFYNFVENKEIFVYFQLINDLTIETFIIYVTGGIDSSFSFLYFFTIIAASIILFRRGALIIASLSSFFYSLMISLMYNLYIPLPFNAIFHSQKEIFFDIFLNIFAFITVGLLISYLSENLKRYKINLAKKSRDLKDLQAFHQNVIDCMSSGLIATDLKGDVTFLNPAAEDITGYELKELKGKQLFEIFLDPTLSFAAIVNNLKNQKIYRFENECIAKSGEIKFLGASLTPLKEKEAFDSGYILIFQDLTDLKKLEEQIKMKDRMAIIGEMATGIAHEIRNPLAAMSGSVQLMAREIVDSKQQKELMHIILKETKRLNKIITNFLEYSKPLKSQPVEIDLARLLIEAVTLLENSEEFKKNHHITIYPEKEKFLYFCDPNQMKQVFWNLAQNALRAMPKGGTLEIFLNQNDDDGIAISFKDQGIGISDKELSEMFKPFHGSFEKGFGLGLAIVYRIVENHMGRIEVKPNPDRGTNVSVYFPTIKHEHFSGYTE
jgi:two-component system sensor histidine kinase PilS (NtrC family)